MENKLTYGPESPCGLFHWRGGWVRMAAVKLNKQRYWLQLKGGVHQTMHRQVMMPLQLWPQLVLKKKCGVLDQVKTEKKCSRFRDKTETF